MEEKGGDEERWILVDAEENSLKTPEDGDVGGGEEEDDEEALSLCDLPIIHQSRKHINGEESKPLSAVGSQGDFNFCYPSKESVMCAADEVFFQGQILPLRHSVSSGKGLSQYCDSRSFSRSIWRSESVDYHSSGGLLTSRSSSISSHQSSSSGSFIADPTHKARKPPLNPFHSHPSPSPRIQGTCRTNNKNYAKKTSAWNVLPLGLVKTPPKIAFEDLKTRTNSKNFGSRNSIRSSNDRKKTSARFLGGCNCSLDAVDTVPSRVRFFNRSSSDSNCELRPLRLEEENLLARRSPKKGQSRRRTFEWLRQLSLEETANRTLDSTNI